jgi:hypothetical protein
LHSQERHSQATVNANYGAGMLDLKHGNREAPQLEAWVAETRLRAQRRIGELTGELERGHGSGGGKTSSGGAKSFKTTPIKAAGLSVTEAHRCERIARFT